MKIVTYENSVSYMFLFLSTYVVFALIRTYALFNMNIVNHLQCVLQFFQFSTYNTIWSSHVLHVLWSLLFRKNKLRSSHCS
jgi:hypothetical protein